MDSLRSCYRTWMRFPGFGLVLVQWYWTDKPPLDETHVYGSHNHSRDQGWDDVDTGDPGEVWSAERVWVNGAAPELCPCEGPRGDANAWLGLTDKDSPSWMVGIEGGSNAIASGRSVATHTGEPLAGIASVLRSYGRSAGDLVDIGNAALVSYGAAIVSVSAPITPEARSYGAGDTLDRPIGLGRGDTYGVGFDPATQGQQAKGYGDNEPPADPVGLIRGTGSAASYSVPEE